MSVVCPLCKREEFGTLNDHLTTNINLKGHQNLLYFLNSQNFDTFIKTREDYQNILDFCKTLNPQQFQKILDFGKTLSPEDLAKLRIPLKLRSVKRMVKRSVKNKKKSKSKHK